MWLGVVREGLHVTVKVRVKRRRRRRKKKKKRPEDDDQRSVTSQRGTRLANIIASPSWESCCGDGGSA
ncbi:hypothetical protein E2C01_049216 [Portunus trituberculatus]|uniref:Uncharacterized protein n=1 Tax=Portunus trituberculatus TaxID=210409 RepID=A0A5B7GFG6_PORTR|nr:hypothetical protein [Portunus trituberculatus]